MLALAQDEARKIGLSEIRLTCGRANIASRKIIEKNGGSLIAVEPEIGELLHAMAL
jgi:predicted acetyltransferase